MLQKWSKYIAAVITSVRIETPETLNAPLLAVGDFLVPIFMVLPETPFAASPETPVTVPPERVLGPDPAFVPGCSKVISTKLY